MQEHIHLGVHKLRRHPGKGRPTRPTRPPALSLADRRRSPHNETPGPTPTSRQRVRSLRSSPPPLRALVLPPMTCPRAQPDAAPRPAHMRNNEAVATPLGNQSPPHPLTPSPSRPITPPCTRRPSLSSSPSVASVARSKTSRKVRAPAVLRRAVLGDGAGTVGDTLTSHAVLRRLLSSCAALRHATPRCATLPRVRRHAARRPHVRRRPIA